MQQMKKFEYFFVCLSYVLIALVVLGQVTHYTGISQVCFYATFVTTLILWLLTLLERFDKIDFLAVLILVLSFTNVAINGIASDAEFSFDYIKKLIMFDSAIIYFAAAGKITLDAKIGRIIAFIYAVIGILMIAAYFIYGRKMYLLNGQYVEYLTFRFTNPNLTSVFLSLMAMFLCVFAMDTKNLLRRIILFAVAFAEMIFVVQTKSRNAEIAVFAFAICIVVLIFRKKSTGNTPKWLFGAISVSPMIFAWTYMQMQQSSTLSTVLDFLVSEGKLLNSRAEIWSAIIRIVKISPIMGAYYQISEGTGTSQCHNSHLDILASYGIVVLILFCVYLYKLLLRKSESGGGFSARLMLIGFVGVIFIGFGEATIFSGGLGDYLLAGIFLFNMPNSQPGGLKNERYLYQQLLQPSPE